MGLNGIEVENGATSHYVDDASIVRAMIHQTNQKIVVADHSNIGGTARVDFAKSTKSIY